MLFWDLAGIYTNSYDATLNARNGFPVFSTQVEANWLSKSEDKYAAFRLTDEDKDEINRLSKDPNIGERQHSPLCNAAWLNWQSLAYYPDSSATVIHVCIQHAIIQHSTS